MKRRKYQRGGASITGYKKSSPDKENDFNIIPGKSITMKDVKGNVIGVGLDKNGNMSSMRFMKPEEEYDFKKAQAVFEIPEYQGGGIQPNFFTSPLEQTTLQKNPQGNPLDVSMFNMPDYNNAVPQEQGNYYDEYFNNLQNSQSAPQQPQRTPVQKIQTQVQGVNMAPNTIKTGSDAITTQDLNIQNQTVNSPIEQTDISGPPKFEFFNPYNGVDIPSAASMLGSSIESGNTLGIVGSGLKLATGLGRNIVGGIGQQRRNQFAVDEYNKKQKDAMTKATYQKGGELNSEDIVSINQLIGDVDFAPETIQNLFEKVGQKEKVGTYSPNLGKYGDVGYFDVDKIDGDSIILNTTRKNPYNAQTYKQLLPYLEQQNPGKKVNINYVPKSFEEGGELTQEEILAGEYSGQDAFTPNAEIEEGEYRADNSGSVTEVKGDTHENGGVPVQLEEGERILSDHTKIGKTVAEDMRNNFDIEVKAKDTYATILDKFVKKSGLEKIYEEQEGLIKKVEKETEKDDSSTKDINMEFLSKKINELEEKKKPLEATKKMLFDKIYDIQESKKPNDEQPQEEFQVGGQMYSSDQIVDYAKKFNIEPDRAKELVLQLGGQFGAKGAAKDLPEGQSQDTSTGLFGEITQQQLSEAALRNPWFNWNNFDPKDPNDVLRFQQEFNKRSTEGATIKEDGKFGIQTQSVMLPFSGILPPNLKTEGIAQQPMVGRQYSEPTNDLGIPTENDKTGRNLGLVMLPDQNPLLPSALQPVLKNQRRYGRLEPTMIDPTQQLSEIDRSNLSAQSAINERPDSARAATIAQLAANTQDATSKTISQTNQLNQRASQQADAFNVRQGDREVDAGAADALSYEQRMFQGMSNTENDIRDYFQTMQNVNMENFRTINELNYMNALNDKFQFDGTGFVQTGRGDTAEEMAAKVRFAQSQQKMRWGGKRKKKSY